MIVNSRWTVWCCVQNDAVQVGDQVEVKKGYFVRPFPTVHVIPSQGYLVYAQKKKLKEEFQGAGKDAIIAAKKSGIDVNMTWQVWLLHHRCCSRVVSDVLELRVVLLWKRCDGLAGVFEWEWSLGCGLGMLVCTWLRDSSRSPNEVIPRGIPLCKPTHVCQQDSSLL